VATEEKTGLPNRVFGRRMAPENGPRPEARPWRWELQGGIAGGNVDGRILLGGPVTLGDPNGADFPRPDRRLGSALLAAVGAVLLNFA